MLTELNDRGTHSPDDGTVFIEGSGHPFSRRRDTARVTVGDIEKAGKPLDKGLLD
jgi:hypothetical protein